MCGKKADTVGTGVKGGAAGTFPKPGLCARLQEAPEDDSAGQLRPQQRTGSPGQSPSARSPRANPLPAPSLSSSHVVHGALPSIAQLSADWGKITNTRKCLSPSGDCNTFQASHHCPYKESIATPY